MSQDVCSFCERDLRMKKKKKEKETLSILQQCFECERKASKWERFGPSDLNDNPRPFILIGRHQDRLKKRLRKTPDLRKHGVLAPFHSEWVDVREEVTLLEIFKRLLAYLKLWGISVQLFFCAFPPSIQLYLVTVGSHTAWIVCMFHDI